MDNIELYEFDKRDDTLLLFLLRKGAKMARESQFERDLIIELEGLFPGCVILKNNPNFFQGIPDRLILYRDRWAAFEVKDRPTAKHQQNQDYYVDLFNKMSFAAFVYPQNKEWFINELQKALRPDRGARLSKR